MREDELLNQLLKFRGELIGYIRSIVRDPHDAEDLFQEVAAIIVKKSETDIDVQYFRAWSKEIARRQVLQFYRERKGDLHLPTEEMLDVVSCAYKNENPDHGELEEEKEALRDCMKSLPGKITSLLDLRFMKGVAFLEIAKQFEKTESAVRRAVSRARLVLLECVQGKLGTAAVKVRNT